MRNKFSFLALAILLIASFWSCQNKNEDVLSDLKGESLNFETFFEKVSNKDIKLSEEKVLLINYEWNAKDKTITILSSKEAEPSWGLAFDVAEKVKTKSFNKEAYKVSCNNGKNSWTKTCDGKWSCGKLAYKCLEQGGCATICKNDMVYVRETNTFYISENIEDLIERQEGK